MGWTGRKICLGLFGLILFILLCHFLISHKLDPVYTDKTFVQLDGYDEAKSKATVVNETSPFVKVKSDNDSKYSCATHCLLTSSVSSTMKKKVLVFGASTSIGSSIVLRLFEKNFDVVPIETEDIHSLHSFQYRNWQELVERKLDPLVVQLNEIESKLDELSSVSDIIYVPRRIFDSVLERNIFKEEGVLNLEYFVKLLEAIKDRDVRITLITKPINLLSRLHLMPTMQSAWLGTLETSVKTYQHIYQTKSRFIRVSGSSTEMQNTVYKFDNSEIFNQVECVLHSSDIDCFDLDVAPLSQDVISTVKTNLQENNVVMSTYFTTPPNPQYRITIRKNSFRFMQNWLVSANRLGIKAVIFHDSLSDDFIRSVNENFDNVVFNKIDGFKGRTPNDYRFYLVYKYLKEHPDLGNVIVTDIRDVKFFNDPFEVMDVIGGNHVYVGIDASQHLHSWSHPYIRRVITACHPNEANSITVKSHPFYNAGVIGGTREFMLKYLEAMTQAFDHTPTRNCNMGTITVITHKYFRDEAFTGYPFQSAFKMNIQGPQGVAIKHKIERRTI